MNCDILMNNPSARLRGPVRALKPLRLGTRSRPKMKQINRYRAIAARAAQKAPGDTLGGPRGPRPRTSTLCLKRIIS
ncbi:hypothetical protein EVAR_96917_1 [Eumeta japonica]|uniref:Uncharacterized protein n=1 Tax=Eumeta variegata TaxID=151549 RepID=A0A4C1WC15_EUMVA|nr:hypothetical protein EVAR_96917_1 [Eumeta japonica]